MNKGDTVLKRQTQQEKKCSNYISAHQSNKPKDNQFTTISSPSVKLDHLDLLKADMSSLHLIRGQQLLVGKEDKRDNGPPP